MSNFDITTSTHELFTTDNIKLLNKKFHIFTIIDFLKSDPKLLINCMELSYKVLMKIRDDLKVKYFYTELKTGFDYSESNKQIPTNIKTFDALLDGGLFAGTLNEICGLPSVGKTQLCLTICANFSQFLNFKSIYIDTKGDHLAFRVHQIFKNRSSCQETCNERMKNIIIERITNLEKLIKSIKYLIENFNVINSDIKLVVIDSLPSIWLLLDGTYNAAMSKLMELGNLLKKLAIQHSIIVIVVNIIINSIQSNNSTIVDDLTPKIALGKQWLAIPVNRYLLLENKNPNNKSNYTKCIKILKNSNLYINNYSYLNIRGYGVL